MIQRAVREALRGRMFSSSLDLGCGTGDGGILIRPHTTRLIGVDVNPAALKTAWHRGVYDELYVGDMRTYPFDSADSIFMFDIIEHVPKIEGYQLLERFGYRFAMLTTPWWNIPFLSNSEHKCVWSEGELRGIGFKTCVHNFMPDLFMSITYGGTTLGVREEYR